MSCIIAILLTSVARMVVVSSEYEPDYYAVFATPKIDKFPVPNDSHEIHVSASKIAGPGTYVVAYCSLSLSNLEMVDIIIRGQPEVTYVPGKTTTLYLKEEKACMKSIIDENSLGSDTAMLSKLDKDKCTHQLIASLAFKGLIGVEGEFSCFAPPLVDQPIKVKADIPIHMHQFLSQGVFLRGENIESKERALVWFQGNLHLLRRSKTNNNGHHSWSPVTSIGKERTNGRYIAEFIRSHLPSIREFTDIMHDYHVLVLSLITAYSSSDWRESKSNFKKGTYRNVHDLLDDLCMLENGFKEKRCGRITNASAYLIKNAHDIGLLCPTGVMNWARWSGKRECIFRPVILPKNQFRSNQLFYSTSKNVLEIPPQSNKREVAARFTELEGIGTLCETNSHRKGKGQY